MHEFFSKASTFFHSNNKILELFFVIKLPPYLFYCFICGQNKLISKYFYLRIKKFKFILIFCISFAIILMCQIAKWECRGLQNLYEPVRLRLWHPHFFFCLQSLLSSPNKKATVYKKTL
jgi:hypothetical protein